MDVSQTDNVIDINPKEDGVYLSISHPSGAPKVSRVEVLAMVESYGVISPDFVLINDMLQKEDEFMEFKISDNPSIVRVNESASVEVAKDRMTASLIFSPPLNKGNLMTREEIIALLEKSNIKNFNYSIIDRLLVNKRYESSIIVAEGKEPVPGSDGYLQYHFDRSHLRPKPKILDDGTVNFHQLGLLRLCNKGDVLVTVVPPSDGEYGEDVYGTAIPFPKLKSAQAIPKGKNTVLSENGQHLIAEVSGQLLLADGKINISPCLEIVSNIDNSTGDIEFNGEVHIRGNVVSGFKVIAEGNIEVNGACEAATLISKGSIILNGGVQGMDKAVLKADKDITAKFMESCNAIAGGNITADSILKSVVKCDGILTLTGRNGLLAGGSAVVGEKLIAKTIGSNMGTATEVSVGGNPREIQKHKELVEEYNKTKLDFERIDTTVNSLTALKQKGQLTEEKKTILVKMVNTKMQMRDNMNKMQDQIDELVRVLSTNYGTVSVSKFIKPGVRVIIGNAQLNIREELSNCRLRNDGSKISIGPNL